MTRFSLHHPSQIEAWWRADDLAAIAGWVQDRWGVECSETRVALMFAGRFMGGMSDAHYAVWIKSRLDEAGRFRGRGESTREWIVGTLHVGFVGVPETIEQVWRLRRETGFIPPSQISRSKMFQGDHQIAIPINRVSYRTCRAPSGSPESNLLKNRMAKRKKPVNPERGLAPRESA